MASSVRHSVFKISSTISACLIGLVCTFLAATAEAKSWADYQMEEREKTSAAEAEELRLQVEDERAEMAQNAQARAEDQARAAQQQHQRNVLATAFAAQALNGVAQQQVQQAQQARRPAQLVDLRPETYDIYTPSGKNVGTMRKRGIKVVNAN